MFPDTPAPPATRRSVRLSPRDAEVDLSFYGLVGQPFGSSLDSRFVFESRSQAEGYRRVAEALDGRFALVAVVADDGVGKSTLCREIARQLPPPAKVIAVDAVTSDDLLTQILQQVAGGADVTVPPGPDSEQKRRQVFLALQRHLAERMHDTRVVVMADDAQRLQSDALEWLLVLSNLASGNAMLLRVLLVGSPQLDLLLRKERVAELAPRGAFRWRLTPLRPSEVASYVAHRLSVAIADAPGATAPRFTNAAVRALYGISSGVPATLNKVAARALALGAERGAAEIEGAIVREAAESLVLSVPASRKLTATAAAVAAAAATVVLFAWPWRARDATTSPTPNVEATTPRPPEATADASSAPAPAAVPEPAVVTPPAPGGPPPSVVPTVPAASLPISAARVTGGPPAPEDRQPTADLPTTGPVQHVVAAGLFRNPKNADDLTAALIAKGLPAFIRHDSGRGVHLVYVGPYATSDEARAVLPRVQTEFGLKDAIIRTERPASALPATAADTPAGTKPAIPGSAPAPAPTSAPQSDQPAAPTHAPAPTQEAPTPPERAAPTTP